MEDPSAPSRPPGEAGGAPGEPEPALSRGAIEFLGLGLTIAVVLAVGTGLGYLIDGWAHTGPVFTVVGLFVGVAAAVLMTVSRVRKYL